MTTGELKEKIREYPTCNRCDLSRLLADSKAFAAAVTGLAEPFRDEGVDKVAALEAMGLPLGGAVAVQIGAGFIMLRKPGKVAWAGRRASFRDYKKEESYLEIAEDALIEGDRVLIIDDWSETGAQLKAAADLVESLGAKVVGISVLNADSSVKISEQLEKYRLHTLFSYTT